MTVRKKPAAPRSRRALEPVEKGDIAVARAVAIDDTSIVGRLIGRFAELGDQPPMRILCSATMAAGLAGRDRRLIRTALRMSLAHSVATLGKAFVKDGVDRTRPGEAIDSREYRMRPGDSHAHRLQSMPSGHSAGVVAVAAAAIVDYPQVAGPAAASAAAIIAAQLPSRNHFLTDVAAGSAIGLAAFGLARLLLPPGEPSRRD